MSLSNRSFTLNNRQTAIRFYPELTHTGKPSLFRSEITTNNLENMAD